MFDYSIRTPEFGSFEKELEFADELRINNVETSDVFFGKRLCALDGEETEKLRDLLIDSGKKIVLLECSLPLSDEDGWKMTFRKALTLNVRGIGIVLGEKDDPSFVCFLSKTYSIPLYIKNTAGSFVEDENRMKELTDAYPELRLIFDPYEFVCKERHPFFHAYYASKIKDRIDFLRINDGLYGTHERVMLHSGCCEIKELASIMLSRSYKGYFSFTPYLDKNGLDTYKETIKIFKNELKNM